MVVTIFNMSISCRLFHLAPLVDLLGIFTGTLLKVQLAKSIQVKSCNGQRAYEWVKLIQKNPLDVLCSILFCVSILETSWRDCGGKFFFQFELLEKRQLVWNYLAQKLNIQSSRKKFCMLVNQYEKIVICSMTSIVICSMAYFCSDNTLWWSLFLTC